MINKKPEKITRTILNFKNLVLKIHVRIMNDQGSYHSEYEYMNSLYLKLDTNVYLTLEIMSDEWSKDKTLIITQNNIQGVVNTLKNILHDIYSENIFANKPNGEIIAYKDMVDKFTRKISLYGTSQQMLIRPGVIYDDNEVSYEGAILYINRFENKVELPIELLETLYYTLKEIDLFSYSQLLINYFVSYYKNGNTNLFENGKKTFIPKPKVNFNDVKEESIVSSYVPNNDKENLFSGIKGKETNGG